MAETEFTPKEAAYRQGYIYALRCPLINEIRYVGRTVLDPRRRLSKNLSECDKNHHHTANWLSMLKRQRLRPIIEILEKIEILENIDNYFDRECFWIDKLRSEGCPLTNTAPGGPGGSAPNREISAEHREKLALAAKLAWQDPVIRERQIIAIKATLKSLERSDKIRRSKIGKKRSPETVLAMSRGNGGKPFTDQYGKQYETVNGCARELGVPATEVSRVLRGISRHTHGYMFKFLENV